MLTHTKGLIKQLDALGRHLETKPASLRSTIETAYNNNRWFTEANIEHALEAITTCFLKADKLEAWISAYDIKEKPPKKIGLIMAGNIPLVGFHDLLAVLITGNIALIKLSSKDNILLPYLLQQLFVINPTLKTSVEIVDRLNNADAIIATGSNNSSRYFDYYFARFPKIIRKNRGSVAVLTGNETPDDFLNLGIELFRYFGLGCRNVSKLYVPEGYNFDNFFLGIYGYADIIYHNKYKNNFDYSHTLLLMNKTWHLTNDFVMLLEDKAVSSPVAVIHFEYYADFNDLENKLAQQKDDIQCVVGSAPGQIPFGQTQEPTLTDYADGVDVVEFLVGL